MNTVSSEVENTDENVPDGPLLEKKTNMTLKNAYYLRYECWTTVYE